MGKRTSDFMALTAILGGAGLGLGLTSLYARTASVPHTDDSSMEIHVVRGRVMVGDAQPELHWRARPSASVAPTIYRFRSWVPANGPEWAPLERLRVDVEELWRVEPETKGFDREQLERLRAQVEELRRAAGGEFKVLFEAGGLEALLEALEGVEALEDLDLRQNLTIDIRQDERKGHLVAMV